MKTILKKISRIFGDKALHLIMGFVAAFITFWYAQFILWAFSMPNYEVSIVLALYVSLAAGLFKEFLDYMGTGTVDKYDVIYTFIGGILGVAINLFFIAT